MIYFNLALLSTTMLLLYLPSPMVAIIPNPKNVLMIVVDDLRPQLECQNLPGTTRPHMHTPHICNLASQSLHLMQNHAPMAHCSPSRTATLTGRSVGTTRVYDLFTYFRNVSGNFTTIPQFFKNKGYRTTAIGKIFHHGVGTERGDGNCPLCSYKNDQDQLYSWSDKIFWGGKKESMDRSWEVVEDGRVLRDTKIMLKAVEQIKERGKERESPPFFMAVGFHRPHLPFVAPEEFYNWYNPEDVKLPLNPHPPPNLPKVLWDAYGETRSYVDVLETGATGQMNTTLPDYKTLELRRGYYAAVSYTDYNVGQVLSALRNASLEKDTIVIFWGDHGWSLGEHGRWDKHTNFDTDTHCPLMIKVPGLTDGGFKSQELTGLIDLFPTLVELVFGKEVLETELPYCPKDSSHVETCREGLSLVPLLQNPSTKIRDTVFTVYASGIYPQRKGKPGISRCPYHRCIMKYSMQTYIKEKVYRYTEAVPYTDLKPRWGTVLAKELHNRFDDPGENDNIVDYVSPILLRKLEKRLHEGSVWTGTPYL